jgi:hypothetical protein
MNKFPVGQTIAFGYAFLVTEFNSIVRICWMPSLLIVAADYLLRRYTLFYMSESVGIGSALAHFAVLTGAVSLWLFSSSIMAVGVTRLAMRMPLEHSKIYFPLGWMELHMFAANIRYILSMAILFILAALLSALVLSLAGAEFDQVGESTIAGPGIRLASLGVAIIFGYLAVSAVRLVFFLPAVVVTEDRGLRCAHSTTDGNVWRVLTVLVAISAPLILISALCDAVILVATFGREALTGDPSAVFENMETAAAAQPLAWALYRFAFNIALMGIVPSTAAFAYMKLKEGAGDTPNVATPPPRGLGL